MSSGIVKNNPSVILKNNPDFIIDNFINKRLEFSELNDLMKLTNSCFINKNDCLLLLDKIRTILTEDKKSSLKDKNFCCYVERIIMKTYLRIINNKLNV